MLEALDALPEPVLISEELIDSDGDVCALGCVGQARGMDMSAIDYEETDEVGKAFGIARALAAEIAYENDEGWYNETPYDRFKRVRRWVVNQLLSEPQEPEGQNLCKTPTPP